MGFNAELLSFSENPLGNRLATFLVTMPRSILAEGNTHRALSRNAASSRAMPTRVLVNRVIEDPYIPDWTKNGSGMGGERMSADQLATMDIRWLVNRDRSIASVLYQITGVEYSSEEIRHMPYEFIAGLIDSEKNKPHKQDINRILEPWVFMEWVVSGTDWANFFFQRVHRAAHPAFQEVAYRMAKLYLTTCPKKLEWMEWHLPFVDEDDWDIAAKETGGNESHFMQDIGLILAKVSSARCGRVSFAKQGDGKTLAEDLDWFQRHIYENAATGNPQHVSPAEHAAHACQGRHGNFNGFYQLRKMIPGENHAEWGITELNRYEEETGRELTAL